MTKIGVLREGKVPHDFRVPFSPEQVIKLQDYFGVDVVVQPSPIRCFKDSEYIDAGIELVEDLSDCDIIFGVKEVPIDNLIEGKKYAFFSHTIKEQKYNEKLMRVLIAKKNTMIDYETLVGPTGRRLSAFGREAGIVGTYNALRAYGIKTKSYDIPLAHTLCGLYNLYDTISKLPDLDIRVMITGAGGRVSVGAVSVLEKVNLKSLTAEEYLSSDEKSVFVALKVEDYIKRIDGGEMIKSEFYKDPTGFDSNFMPYAKVSDIYVSAHFWDKRSCVFFDMDDIADKNNFPLQIISDVSCDLPGPIPTTLRETTLEDTTYDISRIDGKEYPAFSDDENHIVITAVDNLPSSIPCDASVAFGESLIEEMLPYYLGEDDGRIDRATICSNGELGKNYEYLKGYAGL